MQRKEEEKKGLKHFVHDVYKVPSTKYEMLGSHLGTYTPTSKRDKAH